MKVRFSKLLIELTEKIISHQRQLRFHSIKKISTYTFLTFFVRKIGFKYNYHVYEILNFSMTNLSCKFLFILFEYKYNNNHNNL